MAATNTQQAKPVKANKVINTLIIANPQVVHGCLFSIDHKNPQQCVHGVYQN